MQCSLYGAPHLHPHSVVEFCCRPRDLGVIAVPLLAKACMPERFRKIAPAARSLSVGVSHALESLSDADLLQRCKDGQQTAWSVLVRRYQRLIFTIPRRAGLGEDQAADVFQSTFTRLVENCDGLQDPSRLRAWLVTTARRETLGLLALAQRTLLRTPDREDGAAIDQIDPIDPIEQIADPSPLPDELLADLQMQDLVRRAVDKLDDKSRALVDLLFTQAEPPPYSQIAARLGIAEGSIGPTRARVLGKLRAILQSL